MRALLRRRLAPALVPLLLAALLPGCGGSGSSSRSASPPFVFAVVIGLPAGEGAPYGVAGTAVQVLDSDTGLPLTGATVTIDGVALPWSAANQDYEGAFAPGPGASVNLAVGVAGTTYRAAGTFFAEAPAISVAGPAPSRCDNRVAWSGGSPAGTGPTLVAVFDPANPDTGSLYGPVMAGPGAGEIAIPAGALVPGERLVLVGISAGFPVPGATEGSALLLVGARTAPLTVVDADYRELTLGPGYRGLAIGEPVQLQATGPSCGGGEPRDLTATATWTSSDPAVIEVGDAAGAKGLATGAGNGTATITADVQGIRGSTRLAGRDFVHRDSTVPGEMLGAVGWTGSTIVALGSSGTVLTSVDGVGWTARPSGTTASFTSVAASPGLVAAVQYGSSTVLTSPDLVAWTPHDAGPAASSGLWSILWTGDRFVAVGIGGAIVTSPDGVTWTARASGTPYTLAGVAQGGSQLVAVGGIGGLVGQVVTSPDGVTWTERDLPAELGYPGAIVWDGTRFLAEADHRLLASPDGVTWTPQAGPGGLRAMAAAPGEVMAVGEGGAIATTADGGATWFGWKVGDLGLTGVTWAGRQWVIVGAYGTILTAP